MEEKLEYLENKLREIWDDDDFVYCIVDDFEFEEEVNEMINFVETTESRDPSDYNRAYMDIKYGKGNWEKGQLVEFVDED